MLTARKHNKGSRRRAPAVGLDIDAGSVAATQLSLNGSVGVENLGIAPLEPGIFAEGEVVSAEELSPVLRRLFTEHKLPRNVRVGIASQKVAVRGIRLPMIEKPDELEAAVRFQAQEQIPMPLEQAALDYRVVAQTMDEEGRPQIEVVVVAARRELVRGLIEAVRGAGLRPVGIDLSAFAMIRALAPRSESRPPAATDAPREATVYCNIGDAVNLAVSRDRACLFTRVAPFGVESIAANLAERRQLTLEHSRQWLFHVGLDQPAESIDGDPEIVRATREVLEEGGSRLLDELRLSIEFYGQQDGALPIGRVVVTGPGSAVPGLIDLLGSGLGIEVAAGRPGPLASLDEQSAARLTLSYGLALEE